MSNASSCSSSSPHASSVEHEARLLEVLPALCKGLGLNTSNWGFLGKGMFNIVFHFDLQKADEVSSPLPCVIRIANAYELEENDDCDSPDEIVKQVMTEACERTLNSALVLRHVHQYISNTPEMLHVDATQDNALKCPFSIQTRLPGQPMEKIWKTLDLAAKFEIAEQVADFRFKAETVKFKGWGQLKAASTSGIDGEHHSLRPEYELSSESPLPPTRTLKEECQRLLLTHNPANQQLSDEDEPCDVEDLVAYGKLCHVFAEMSSDPALEQYFSANIYDAHFAHIDLHMGNILISPSTDSNGKTSYKVGIIDFDCLASLPKILSRGAPAFLWQNDIFEENPDVHWDGDVDFTPRKFRDFRDHPHGDEVKSYYDWYVMDKLYRERGSAAVREWWESTYGDATLVRRIASLVLWGLDASIGCVQALEELSEERRERIQGETVRVPFPLDLSGNTQEASGEAASDAFEKETTDQPPIPLEVDQPSPGRLGLLVAAVVSVVAAIVIGIEVRKALDR
ncbi:MAG: hypothetical protein Q9162_004015 [Coniocarpon cinnabarinum]